MRRLILVSSLLGLCSLPRLARAEDVKIGYVDLQRAIGETNEGQSARKKLKSIFDKKQKELDEKQQELQKLKADFDKKKSILKPEAAQEKAKELEGKFVDLQQTYVRLQKDLSDQEQKVTQPIFVKMRNVIAKIAERDNFAMILDQSSGLLWAKPSMDLTNEAIRRYNAGEGSGGKGNK